MQQSQKTLPVGSIVDGRYRVESLLGKGGFGAVYLVRDLRVRQNVFALKELIESSQQERRHFTLEADLLKRTDHPSLPRVYRAFDDPESGRAYLLMDYIEGPNLERLRREQPAQRFTLGEVYALLGPIVEAIAYLHARQPPIIHRDIKPSNIIVPVVDGRPVLVDFGIAKEFDQEATTTAIRHASPGYGAPEQYGSGTNTRTDIYGLGATVYVLLTGVIPVNAFFRLTRYLNHENDPLVPVQQYMPGIPEYVAAAIERAMALESEQRFATVEDFWQALRPAGIAEQPVAFNQRFHTPVLAEAAGPVSVSGTDRTVPPARPSARGKWVAWALLLVLVLGTGLAFTLAFLLPSTQQGPRASSSTLTPAITVTHAATATTPSPTSTPTSPPAQALPVLASAYAGTVHNNNANLVVAMFLSGIVQHQQTIQGNFAVNSPLNGSGPFTGTVASDASIQFTVHSSDPGANAPLHFSGTIQANGNISGSYCSLDGANQCNPAVGGYGTWFVHPGSSL